jgi:SIR2-like domain
MKTKIYDWKRYWHKQNESPSIFNGFLVVHEFTKDIFTLDSVSDVPCIVLLGEPGMGKSKEIERIYESQIPDDKNDKLRFNLSSTGEEKIIRQSIFESDKINKWKQNDSNLYLFLDSLDEALLNINTLAILLAEELEKLPIERLYLRIACRTAEWSNLSILENKLRYIWKDDKCQILQIAPLQQTNVENTAQTENLDSQKFIAEIFNKNVSVLAAKPVTLRFLVELFRKNNSFPSTQTELYKQGCLTLCEERSETRIASKRIGKLNSEKRLVIAARIAALMVFGNKSSIWIGKTIGQEDADLLLSELYGYSEKVKDIEFQITEEHIKEVVFDTGLFTGNGENRSKFSHQTFAEFLASWYLEYRKVPDETIIEIIGETYLYPQLYETSAWIASQRKRVFQHLMKVAPLILLRSDVLSAEEKYRYELTERLLEIFENEEALDSNFRGSYHILKHSNIAEQLRPFITDKTKGWLVRRVVVDIIEACKIIELQNDLIKLVLDETELHATRVNAAYAVKRIGDTLTKAKLKPLIYGNHSNDEDLELKGVALSALWQEQLTVEEVFAVLVEPPNLLGSYKTFIYDLGRNIKINDLPNALIWLRKKIVETEYLSYWMQTFADEIMKAAWQHLDNLIIFENYISLMLPYLSLHRQGMIDSKHQDGFLDEATQIKRKKILISLLSLLNEQKDWTKLWYSPFLKFRYTDADWLIKEWNTNEDEEIKAKIISLLREFILSGQGFYSEGLDPNFLDLILESIKTNPKLDKELGGLFLPIELDSEKAKKLREGHKEIVEQRNKWNREYDEEPLKPTPKERVLECLEKVENGEVDYFWRLNLQMTLLPTSKHYGNETESDLTRLSGWKEADEETQIRIVEAAKKYIINIDPTKNDEWISYNDRPTCAGYRALKLVCQYDFQFINNLDKDVWIKWSPIIFFYPIFNGDGEDSYNFHQKFIAFAYKIVPEKFQELLCLKIEKENNKKENPHISFDKLELCWDEKLVAVLKSSLTNNKLSEPIVEQILTKLFELNDAEAEKHACNLIKHTIPKTTKSQNLMIIGAKLLIQYGKIICWEKIWRVLNKNAEFGKRMAESGVFQFGRRGLGNLSEKQTADLYLWLSNQYPHNEDPDFTNESMAHFVGPREKIASWRNSLLDYLKNKGTAESVLAIERIKNELPNLDWLKFTLLDANERMRTESWKPIPPENLLQLFMNVENKVAEKTKNEQADISELTFEQKSVSENPYLEDLLKLYKKNPDGIAFFVGAGLSMPLFPSWQNLLTDMIDLCEKNTSITKSNAKIYKRQIKKGENYLDIASVCAKELTKTEYDRFLQKHIDKEISFDDIPANYKELINLKPKIIVTTNFDKIPETLIAENNKFEVCNNQNISNCERYNKESRPFILKLHGCISSMNSIVFTNDDFQQIIHNKPDVKVFMQSLFSTKTFVFIGFSFEDPNIANIFSLLKSIGLNTNPHYALISGIDNFKKTAKQDAFGVRIITYSSPDKSHKEVGEFIKLFSKLK